MLLFILTVADRGGKISCEPSHLLLSIFSIRNLGSCREMRFGLCTRKALEHKGVRGTLGVEASVTTASKSLGSADRELPQGVVTIITKMLER